MRSERDSANGHCCDAWAICIQLEHGSWWAHHRRWWKAAQEFPERVHWVEYETLVHEPVRTINDLVAFLGPGWKRPTTYIERVAHGASFDVMLAQAGEQSKGRKAQESHTGHIRKGGVGGWKEYFTVEQSETFDTVWEREMTSQGVSWQPTYV